MSKLIKLPTATKTTAPRAAVEMYFKTFESHARAMRTMADARRPDAGVATLEMLLIGERENDPVTG